MERSEEQLDQILASLTPEEQLELAKSSLLFQKQQNEALADKFEPQDYQIGLFRSPAKIRMAWGSNRTGKSLCEVAEAYWWATGKHPYRRTPKPPVFIRHSCISYNEGIRQVLLPLYQSFSPPEDLLGGSWDRAYSKEDRTLYFANGSQCDFMCFAGEQSILMADGTWKLIKNIEVDDIVQTPEGLGSKVVKIFNYENAPLLRIKTWGGNVLLSTPNHKHNTVLNGLIEAKDLKSGMLLDRIGAKLLKPVVEEQPEWKIGWTAIMIGDGCLRGKTPFFTVSNKKDELLKNLPPLPPFCHFVQRGGNLRADYYFISTDREKYPEKNKENSLKKSLEQDGLWDKTSIDKFIPSWVFRLPDNQLKMFLRYLWSTDGCIRERQASYSTISEQLATDVKHLLWRLDISASIIKSFSQGGFCPEGVIAYQVLISADYNKFCEQVGKIGVENKVYQGSFKYDPRRIRIIEEMEEDTVYCVEIDSQEHLLIADGIVSSNSFEQDANKFSGVRRHLNIYDEPPLQDIWYENQARLIDFNGHTFIGLTPILTARSAFIKEDLYDKAGIDKDIEMFFFDIFKNKYLNKEARDAYIKTIPPDEREARIYGRIIMLAGLIYNEFRDSQHIVEGFPITNEHTIFISVDPHPRKPTYVLFGAVDHKQDLYLWDEINMKAGVPEICKVIKTKLGKRTLEQGWIDNSAVEEDLTSGESILQQFIDNGIYLNPIEGRLKNNTMGFQAVKNRLGVDEVSHKPTMFFFKNGVPILIHAMKNYAYDDYFDPRLAGVKEKPFKRYDDPPDALRYMVINNPYYVSLAKRRYKQEQEKGKNIYSYLKK